MRAAPALKAAMASVAFLLVAGRFAPGAVNGTVALLLACPAFALVAVGLALPPGREWRRLLLAAAVGLALAAGAELGTRLRGAAAGAGLPLHEIDHLRGVLTGDDRRVGPGTGYRILVDRVGSSRLAAHASARFEVFVIVADTAAARGYRGRRVAARGVALYGVPGAQPVRGRGAEVTLADYVAPAAALRASVRGRVERLVLDLRGPAAALLAAVLLGDRQHLAAEQIAAFRRAGALHLLALSGLHVGLVYVLAATAGRGVIAVGMMVAPRWQRLWVAAAAVIGVGAVFLYVELAGARPSLARATIMLALARLAAATGRRPDSLNVLALSALTIVASDPGAVHEVSFQLSYAALLGILLVGPPVARRLPAFLPPALRSATGMALGAQIATLPLVLAEFGRAHPIGLLSGLLLVPCTALFLWTGIGALVLSALSGSGLDDYTRVPLNLLYSGLTMLNGLFGYVPGIRW